MRAAAWLLVACTCWVLAPRVARSEDHEGLARAHYTLGLAYYDEGKYTEAVAEFEKAYALTQRPELVYNLARAYDHAGDAVRARQHYARYLALGVHNASERAEVESRLAALAGKIGLLRAPSLDVSTEARVDGQRVDGAALRAGMEVLPGAHTIDLFRPGYAATQQRAEVRAGAAVQINSTLTPANRAYPIHRKWWFWTITGAVVTGAVLTGVLVGRRERPEGIVLPTPR